MKRCSTPLIITEIQLLFFATAWIDLENIMLSEISQSDKDKCHMVSLICGNNDQSELTSKIETDS